MKRKLLLVMLVLFVIFASNINAMAGTVVPRYNVVSAIDTTISATTDGVAFDVMLYVPSTTSLDSAWIDIEVRNIAGTVVGTFSGKKMTKGSIYFYYENSCDISTSGTYFFTYEIRCYKDAVLVDNPTGTSTTVSYRA